ncbi:unnamed protein product [Arctia plantaginis]|uniref:Uncharacterized protein n=1 Tax=Arctia plantaginis TaxID=874455 RepID=A0A8S0YRP6_ARCPL|nr:unnamed protein product [Arctia plantaginis]
MAERMNRRLVERCKMHVVLCQPGEEIVGSRFSDCCIPKEHLGVTDIKYAALIELRVLLETYKGVKKRFYIYKVDLPVIIQLKLFPGILSRDARAIIGTVRQIHNIKTIEHGEYWHNGLPKSLQKALENWVDVPNKVKLNFNFDGLPIFKSSNKEFWPILCNIFERPDIEPFVFDTRRNKEGIYIEDRKISIEIRCFICDSPARAYIKGVCNFNAKHGCLKCVTVGEYSYLSHTVTFPETICRPRTDQEFREKKVWASP